MLRIVAPFNPYIYPNEFAKQPFVNRDKACLNASRPV